MQPWRPSLGAWIDESGSVGFRVWAPGREMMTLVLDPSSATPRHVALERQHEGTFAGSVEDAQAGDLYMLSPDGEGPFPDPASRYQPLGVHGPSAIVDPSGFPWSDAAWRGVPLERAVIYELHVGTFTCSGTFTAAAERLPYLADLGTSVVELMPVADFPGARGWGYDGVSLFAPCRAYGTPDDLRRFVDRAHTLGMAVILDVVYNHFGPDGAYATAFSPRYFSTKHHSPWGASVNFDGDDAGPVRRFFMENALHWLHEYHVDGFRLDATHAIEDDSTPHFLEELTATVKASAPGRTVLVIAEDDRNLARIVRPREQDGWGLDAVWADDFHHQVRRRAAKAADGYFADYSGTLQDLAQTICEGWFYRGQFSRYRGGPRGTVPAGVPLERMVVCLQNHDQIGNRAFGDRLTESVSLEMFRALSALLLFVPETPLLFMGQEWGARSPFLYFTDHKCDLGRLVTEGRRAEFGRFDSFADPETRQRIPDPQAESTFTRSRLDWGERTHPPHAGVLELYRTMIALRHKDPALSPHGDLDVTAAAEVACLQLTRHTRRDVLMLVAHLPQTRMDRRAVVRLPDGDWMMVLNTEESRFAGSEEHAPAVSSDAGHPMLVFSGPSAAVLRRA